MGGLTYQENSHHHPKASCANCVMGTSVPHPYTQANVSAGGGALRSCDRCGLPFIGTRSICEPCERIVDDQVLAAQREQDEKLLALRRAQRRLYATAAAYVAAWADRKAISKTDRYMIRAALTEAVAEVRQCARESGEFAVTETEATPEVVDEMLDAVPDEDHEPPAEPVTEQRTLWYEPLFGVPGFSPFHRCRRCLSMYHFNPGETTPDHCAACGAWDEVTTLLPSDVVWKAHGPRLTKLHLDDPSDMLDLSERGGKHNLDILAQMSAQAERLASSR